MSSQPVSPAVRVATWNVQHARRWDTGRPDPDAFASACAALRADVLCLQEVDRRTRRVGGADLLDVAADATGLEAVDGHVVDFDGGTYGNALLVRGDLLDRRGGLARLHRPWLPPWGRPEPRGAVVAGAFGATIVGAHLGLRRRERKRQLAALFRLPGAAPRAVVLGDLNAFGAEVAPHARRAGFELVAVAPAFPASAPRHTIDHVAVRGVAAAPCPDAGRPAVSDHRPVVVELSCAT
jgi:endonuclease/exonuclease/phosphatase family metal-dependent hydrolase